MCKDVMLTNYDRSGILILYYVNGGINLKCHECGMEIDDNELFCPGCNAEIITAIPEADNKKKSAKKKSVFNNKKTGAPEQAAEDKKKKLKLAGILILVVAVIIAIIIIVVNVIASVKANEGRKLIDKIPLGRDIEIIESETGMNFVDTSIYGAVGHIADFDYICESERSVVVDGITVPEWAVVLEKAPNNAISKATLLNFNAIEHNWMGEKTALAIDLAVIDFGSEIKKAERALGLKPYTIIKDSGDNTSVYVYRYHYVDDETENTVVKNLYITVDDVDGKVVDVKDSQVDYMRLILGTE